MKKKQKRGEAMTSTEITICSAFELWKKPPSLTFSIEPVIHQIESNEPYIDVKILHAIEKSIPKMWRNLFVKWFYATGDDMKAIFFKPPTNMWLI